MHQEPGFTARWMPGGLNDRGLRAGELEQPQHHPPLKLFARQRALSQHMASATSLRPTLGGPVGMDVKACTPAGSCFVPKLAVARDGPTSRRRMLAALDVTAETIVASTQRGPSGKKWRRVGDAKGWHALREGWLSCCGDRRRDGQPAGCNGIVAAAGAASAARTAADPAAARGIG
jgi:hypothetical protein